MSVGHGAIITGSFGFMGLGHDGTATAGYYSGQGSGATGVGHRREQRPVEDDVAQARAQLPEGAEGDQAVAQAAKDSGVALRPIADMDAYREKLRAFVYAAGTVMKPIYAVAKRATARRVAYAEGERLGEARDSCGGNAQRLAGRGQRGPVDHGDVVAAQAAELPRRDHLAGRREGHGRIDAEHRARVPGTPPECQHYPNSTPRPTC